MIGPIGVTVVCAIHQQLHQQLQLHQDVNWGNNVYLVDWAENVVYMVTVLPAATRDKRVSGQDHGQPDLVVANVTFDRSG